MTRKELWESLPDEMRVNEVRFREVLEDGVGTLWVREGNGGRDGFRYRLAEKESETVS